MSECQRALLVDAHIGTLVDIDDLPDFLKRYAIFMEGKTNVSELARCAG